MACEGSVESSKSPLPRPDTLVNSRDEDFTPHTWEEAKEIIGADRLDLLDRWPSDARRYVVWTDGIRAKYGSVTNFIYKERLRWEPLPEADRPADSIFGYNNPAPLADPRDYTILRNDWPYRWEEGITHLCVWLKNRIPVDADQGRITDEGRAMVNAFVRDTFVNPLGAAGQENILWYKNWTVLQSVSALEHFHVLVRNVPRIQIDKWTEGDVTIHK